MDSLDDSDSLQPRTSRLQQKVTHEYCPGYMDRNAIWNNGFYCPRWGGPEEVYCCENGREKFCCPEVTTRPSPIPTTVTTVATTQTTTAAYDFVPVVIGASGGVIVLLLVALLACIFCPSCPINKLRHRKPRRSVVLTRTISVSMEAEATSSVIASQAMSPVASTSTQRSSKTTTTYVPSQTSPSLHEDDHLHCGCRWSPTTSRNAVVDINNIVASMYQNTALPWQTELDNLYNCYTCSGQHGTGTLRKSGRDKRDIIGPEGETLLPPNTNLPNGLTNLSGVNSPLNHTSSSRVPTPLRLESFNTTSSAISQRLQPSDIQSPYSCQPALYQHQAPRTYGSLSRDNDGPRDGCVSRGSDGGMPRGVTRDLRDGGTRDSGSSIKRYGGSVGVGTGYLSLGLYDPDRQRRDSGVLVEEADSTDSSFNTQDKLSLRNDISGIRS